MTISADIERNDGEALRYFLLGVHYRSPVNFDVDKLADGRVVFPGLDEAERRVDYLYATRRALAAAAAGADPAVNAASPHAALVREAPERVYAALDNDLKHVPLRSA